MSENISPGEWEALAGFRQENDRLRKELAEATSELPDWVQEVRMDRDEFHGKDWWLVGLSSGWDRPKERRVVGGAYTWHEALADALTPTQEPT